MPPMQHHSLRHMVQIPRQRSSMMGNAQLIFAMQEHGRLALRPTTNAFVSLSMPGSEHQRSPCRPLCPTVSRNRRSFSSSPPKTQHALSRVKNKISLLHSRRPIQVCILHRHAVFLISSVFRLKTSSQAHIRSALHAARTSRTCSVDCPLGRTEDILHRPRRYHVNQTHLPCGHISCGIRDYCHDTCSRPDSVGSFTSWSLPTHCWLYVLDSSLISCLCNMSRLLVTSLLHWCCSWVHLRRCEDAEVFRTQVLVTVVHLVPPVGFNSDRNQTS